MLSTSRSAKLILGALTVILKVTSVLKVGSDTIIHPDLGLEAVGERQGPTRAVWRDALTLQVPTGVGTGRVLGH